MIEKVRYVPSWPLHIYRELPFISDLLIFYHSFFVKSMLQNVKLKSRHVCIIPLLHDRHISKFNAHINVNPVSHKYMSGVHLTIL